MKVRINGCPSKISKKTVRDAVNFAASHLVSKQLSRNMMIEIEFSPTLYRDAKTYGDLGPEHDEDYLPRDFVMRVDSAQSVKNILLTIFHEMVHAKQYAKGELFDYSRNPRMTRWKNKQFLRSTVESEFNAEYFFSPWEQQAYGMQEGLYYLFRKQQKKRVKAP